MPIFLWICHKQCCAFVTAVQYAISGFTGPCHNKTDLFNTLRLRQNGHHFLDDIFKRIFFNKNIWILKFFPKGLIDNNTALVEIMAWRRMLIWFIDAYLRPCVSKVYIFLFLILMFWQRETHVTHRATEKWSCHKLCRSKFMTFYNNFSDWNIGIE